MEEQLEARRKIIRVIKARAQHDDRIKDVSRCPQEPSLGKRLLYFGFAMLVVCLLLFLYWKLMVYLDPEHLDYSS
jgi:hypothetical protein